MRSRTSVKVGTQAGSGHCGKIDRASSRASSATVIAATAPLPLVVRSTVESWMTTS